MGKVGKFIAAGALLGLGAAAITTTAVGCNEHPVSMTSQRGLLEVQELVVGGSSEKLDILWMIDNSGSMCRSQGVLRSGIRDFVQILGEINLDFHIAVTTTHMKEFAEYPLEPVALPGRLQSTPQPVPGFDPACHHPVDEQGQPERDKFDPVLENIQVAIDCTANPEEWAHLATPNLRALECSLDRLFYGCEPEESAPLESFFPDPSAYRQIPKVLRSEDYSDATGALDLDRLAADFSCMSLVGTRGFGYEQGLASIVKALSPELTGGLNGDPEIYPNAGFIREDARLGLIFVADENDCSHTGEPVLTASGTLGNLESSTCGVHQCTIQENLGEDGTLIPVETLRADFVRNYALSKGALSEEGAGARSHQELLQRFGPDIIAASINGTHRIDDTAVSEDCVQGFTITPSCQSEFGIAWSGHRYSEFIAEFPVFFPDPRPVGQPDAEIFLDDMEGFVCSDFEPALQEIANLFAVESGGCIRDIYRCDGPEDLCPTQPSSGEQGVCQLYPGMNASSANATYFCNSGLEIRLALPEGGSDLTRLENTGFCIDGTIGTREFPNSCVIDPVNYDYTACGSGPSLSIDFSQRHPQWVQIIDDLQVFARYTRLPF